MMTNSNIDCPVDFVLMNERKARMTAGIVLVLLVVFFITGSWLIPVFLTLDFFVRGFNLGKYSLLGLISDQLLRVFNIQPKPTDQAPKRFAAKIGFLFSLTISILAAFQCTTASIAVASVMALFALLESFAGFCAGCHVYSFYNKFVKKK